MTTRPMAAARDRVSHPADLLPVSRFLNRELSWLDFAARLLELAQDPSLPLLERAKFLAIVSSGLDEFFQVRVAGLKDQLAGGLNSSSVDGLSPAETLKAIQAQVSSLVATQSDTFLHNVVPGLAEAGIRLAMTEEDLDADDRQYLDQVFEEQVFPVLTPLAVDPAHPFPYISNLSLNLAVWVSDPTLGDRRFARVKVPPLLSRFVVMPDGERFVPLEMLIAAHLSSLFPNMDILSHYPFRVTRNADLTLEGGEADDLLMAVEMELRRRRFARAVRLEITAEAPEETVALLVNELDIERRDVYRVDGPLDLSGLWAVYGLNRPDLHDRPWAPMTQPGLAIAEDQPADIFALIRDHPVLVHHPYDSFATSVEAFIAQAAADPDVLAIKQTLYRTSGDSQIVASLIAAAEAGKQVVVLVELKARFDEQANIAWARALEEAGVHVVYGLVGLKTHAKAALVVRRESGGLRRYFHVGTGNYNSLTARLYEDIGLLSADEEIGSDLSELFNFLTGYSRASSYRKLIVAPMALRRSVIEMVDEQAALGIDGRIVIKVNGLADPTVIDALYRASGAGAQVDLIVRGICCLRPGVPGMSENIRVRSIVGRFLEHSRIYSFGSGDPATRQVFMGSADLMGRNLDGRVEILVPIEEPELRQRLLDILRVNLADDQQAFELAPDGAWHRVRGETGVSAQSRFMDQAMERARRRREGDPRTGQFPVISA